MIETVGSGTSEQKLTCERIREILDYDPKTGIFIHKRRPRVKEGSRAGYVKKRGYREMMIDGRSYREHRLAWLWMKGEWPTHQIDHRDANRQNNAWNNLRPATATQNAQNTARKLRTKSGLKGACFCKQTGKWRSLINVNGKKIELGRHATAEEAHSAYAAAAIKYFGEFARLT